MQFFGFIFRLFLRWYMKQYCASKVVCIYELPLQSMHACRLESVTNPPPNNTPLGWLVFHHAKEWSHTLLMEESTKTYQFGGSWSSSWLHP
jgi:hypothetical protein